MPRQPRTPDFSNPTRREIVHAYVERFTPVDIAHAAHIADDIEKSAIPLANHLVIVPIAAHQEQRQVAPALAQYARQQTDQPFSVILGLNSPTHEIGNPGIDDTLEQIEHAKRQFPAVDIRTSLNHYDSPTIGTIRRDLWNGALLASMDQGAYTQEDVEIIGVNHDIDTISMSPRYVKRIQEHYDRRQRAHTRAGMQSTPHTPSSTLIKHAPDLDFPVISKGVYWIDFYHRQMNTAYEAGMVFPLSYYAGMDGFDPEAKTHEVGSIFPREISQHKILGTNMQTSPRRYIDRLKYGYDKLWTDDSFGPDDQCRLPVIPASDMTIDELEAVILHESSIQQTIANIATRAVYSALSQKANLISDEIDVDAIELTVNQTVNRKLYLTTAVLERIVQSPRLAKQARSLYGNVDFIIDITDRLMAGED
jgi:hypothetical protein